MGMNNLKRQRTVGVIMSYVFLGINSVIGFILNPIMLKFLGETDFGVYQTIATFSNYLLIINFGLGTVITRYVSFYIGKGDKKSKENFLFLSLVITVLFGLIISVAALGLNSQIDNIYKNTLDSAQLGQVHQIFPLLCGNVVINLVAQSFQGVLLGYERFTQNSAFNILRIILRLSSIAVMLVMGYGGLGIAFAEVLTSVVYLLLLLIYCVVNLKVKCKYYFFDKPLFREIVVFSLTLLLQNFINHMNNLLGKFFVSTMVGPEQVTVYANVMTITTMFSAISTAAVSVYLPKATKLVAQTDDRKALTEFIIMPCRIQVILSSLILGAFGLFGGQFVSLWIGEQYIDVWKIAMIIMVPSFFFYANGVIVSVLDALRKKLGRSILMLTSLALNVVLCIVLIPKYEAYGAALATAISVLVVQVVIMNIYYKRGVGIDVWYQFKKIFAGTLPCLIISVVISLPLALYNNAVGFIPFVMNAGCFCVIYLLTMFIKGFNKDERNMIANILTKLGIKLPDNQNAKQKSWQILKGLCIAAVLFIHCKTGTEYEVFSPNFNYWLILRQFINFAVPVFFFASAYFVNTKKVLGSFGSYFKSRFKKLIVPFYVWATIYTVINVGFDILTRTPIDIKTTFINWVTGRVGTPFYFVLVLIQFTLLLPLLVRLSETLKGKIVVYGTCGLWISIVYAYNYIAKDSLPVYETVFLTWLIMYFSGLLCRKNSWEGKGNVVTRWLMMLGAIILGIGETLLMMSNDVSVGAAVSQTRASSLLFSFALINLFLHYKERLDKSNGIIAQILMFMGNNSFGIFFIHCIFRKFSNFVIPFFPFANKILPLYQVIQFVLMLSGSVVAMWIIQKIFRNKSGLLFGVENPPAKKNVSKDFYILDNPSQCTGCYACASACPKKAITMVRNAEGFEYPKIDKEKCVECGVCRQVCPSNKKGEETKIISAKAVVNENSDVRNNSSSGGVFNALAENVLNNGGAIFGAGYDEKFTVVHKLVENNDSVNELMRSKYVQSRIGNSFVETKNILEQGRKVLFVGTPCQISGLKSFLKNDYENLIAVDFICHGVPSPAVWEKYLQNLEKKNASSVSDVSFRSKEKGWGNYSFKVGFADGEQISQLGSVNIYTHAFQQSLTLRQSCYNCSNKSCRASDITLADFWGVKNVLPEWYSEEGVSLVLTHTEKGEKVLAELTQIKMTEVAVEQGLANNPSYKTSSMENMNRGKFFKNLNKIDIESNLKTNIMSPYVWKVYNIAKKIMK